MSGPGNGLDLESSRAGVEAGAALLGDSESDLTNLAKAETALRVLAKRIGVPTEVELVDGSTISVVEVSWGRDRGEAYHYVTAFPDEEGPGVAFFTNEIVRLVDPRDGVVWSVEP